MSRLRHRRVKYIMGYTYRPVLLIFAADSVAWMRCGRSDDRPSHYFTLLPCSLLIYISLDLVEDGLLSAVSSKSFCLLRRKSRRLFGSGDDEGAAQEA